MENALNLDTVKLAENKKEIVILGTVKLLPESSDFLNNASARHKEMTDIVIGAQQIQVEIRFQMRLKMFIQFFHLILKCMIIQTDQILFITSIPKSFYKRRYRFNHLILRLFCILKFDNTLRLSADQSGIIYDTGCSLNLTHQTHDRQEQCNQYDCQNRHQSSCYF